MENIELIGLVILLLTIIIIGALFYNLENSEKSKKDKIKTETTHSTPSVTIEQTPTGTPEQTPTGTTEQTPTGTTEQTPTGTPEQTPTGTPEQTPTETPGETPSGLPDQPDVDLSNTCSTPQNTLGYDITENNLTMGDSFDVTALCSAGFTGTPIITSCEANNQPYNISGCSDIDECALETDNCLENSTCTNTDGSFNCSCEYGKEGDGKEGDGFTGCSEIDGCVTNTCGANSSCYDISYSDLQVGSLRLSDDAYGCRCNNDQGYYGEGSDPLVSGAVGVDPSCAPCVPVENQHPTDPGLTCTNREDSQIQRCAPPLENNIGYKLCESGSDGQRRSCSDDTPPDPSADKCTLFNPCNLDAQGVSQNNPCGDQQCVNDFENGTFNCLCDENHISRDSFCDPITCQLPDNHNHYHLQTGPVGNMVDLPPVGQRGFLEKPTFDLKIVGCTGEGIGFSQDIDVSVDNPISVSPCTADNRVLNLSETILCEPTVNCEGSWQVVDGAECSETCDSDPNGRQRSIQQRFTITRPAAGGGVPCNSPDSYNAEEGQTRIGLVGESICPQCSTCVRPDYLSDNSKYDISQIQENNLSVGDDFDVSGIRCVSGGTPNIRSCSSHGEEYSVTGCDSCQGVKEQATDMYIQSIYGYETRYARAHPGNCCNKFCSLYFNKNPFTVDDYDGISTDNSWTDVGPDIPDYITRDGLNQFQRCFTSLSQAENCCGCNDCSRHYVSPSSETNISRRCPLDRCNWTDDGRCVDQ